MENGDLHSVKAIMLCKCVLSQVCFSIKVNEYHVCDYFITFADCF